MNVDKSTFASALTVRYWNNLCLGLMLVVISGWGICFLVGCNSKEGSSKTKTSAGKTAKDSNVGSKTKKKASPQTSALKFVARAKTAGIDFTYHNGSEANYSTILESLGGGVAALDFDRDGNMDLFFPGGGSMLEKKITGLSAGFFRNQQDWKFHDVSSQCRINQKSNYTHGATTGDFNDDGFEDILVTGWNGLQLWRNLGDGTFEEIHVSAGLVEDQWSSSAAWGDFNGDGNLDLFVCHYVNWSFENHPDCGVGVDTDEREICSPRRFYGLKNALYFSNGDGKFTNASANLIGTFDAEPGDSNKSLGVIAADFDEDMDLDIYVANDTTENYLLVNDGSGKFTESGRSSCCSTDDNGVANGSMGVDSLDFNRDGHLDLWVANYEREAFALYRYQSPNFYLHVSEPMGITALGGLFVGFGTVCSDFDLDGDEDVFVANGHVIKFPSSAKRKQVPLVLENRGKRFNRIFYEESTSDPKYMSTPQEARGLASADFDNDGDQDLAVSHINHPVEVLENRSDKSGNWLAVELTSTSGNRGAIGARLTLETSNSKLLRMVKGGGSYMATIDKRINFGIPENETIKKLEIVWPSGHRQTINKLELNQINRIIEPK